MKICPECQQRFEAEEWRCPACRQAPQFYQGYPVFAPDLGQPVDSYEKDFFSLLTKVEAGHFWFESRNRLILWALQRYFPQAKSFLEIGCGTGFVLSNIQRNLPELAVAGSDIFIEGLAFAATRAPKATLFQMDARCIPFEREFDVIGAFDVLEHITEDELVLAEIFRAIKPGGGLLLTVPQHPFLWSYFDDVSHHKRRYTRSELVKKVEHAGFKICHTTSYISLLLPILLITRWRQWQPQENYDLRAEFEHPWLFNALLRKILDFERGMIRLNLSFPLGGSLLVVAER